MTYTLSERIAHAMAGMVIFGFLGGLIAGFFDQILLGVVVFGVVGGAVSFFKYDALEAGGDALRTYFNDRHL